MHSKTYILYVLAEDQRYGPAQQQRVDFVESGDGIPLTFHGFQYIKDECLVGNQLVSDLTYMLSHPSRSNSERRDLFWGLCQQICQLQHPRVRIRAVEAAIGLPKMTTRWYLPSPRRGPQVAAAQGAVMEVYKPEPDDYEAGKDMIDQHGVPQRMKTRKTSGGASRWTAKVGHTSNLKPLR